MRMTISMRGKTKTSTARGSTALAGLCGALALACVASCGGDGPPPKTLSHADVVGMLPGNATGTTFSGTYVVTAASLDGCHCRVGNCGTFHG
jgi:hypothetical protein